MRRSRLSWRRTASWASPPACSLISPPPHCCFAAALPAAIPDFNEAVEAQLVENSVVGVPGRLFWAETAKAQAGEPCPYMRISFGTLSEEQITEGVRRMGVALRAVAAASAAK